MAEHTAPTVAAPTVAAPTVAAPSGAAPNATVESVGPVRHPTNTYRDAPNSIHNDEVATRLGLRGGTIAGTVHLDQFVPLLLDRFGSVWFERGGLSMRFVSPTTDGEPVRSVLGPSGGGDGAVVVARTERPDGTLVAEGTAHLGDPATPTFLDSIDRRPSPADDLRILRRWHPGDLILTEIGTVPPDDASERRRAGSLTEWVDAYDDPSPWGRAVAGPSGIVGLLWRSSSGVLSAEGGGAVGLFGAIEVRHLRGPVLVDTPYEVTSTVLDVGQSPRAEHAWFDATASDGDGVVASMRMQLRWMKASSSLY